QREVEPVGGGKSVPLNIRVIAASNRSIAQEVKRGHFREDLYYRLNAFPIHIPPLRDRKHDVFDLALFFLHHYTLTEKRSIHGFDKKAEQWLLAHTWPGNVRELENKIYRAVLLCEDSEIKLEHLLYDDSAPIQVTDKPPQDVVELLMLYDVSGKFKSMEQIEREAIRAALSMHENNIRAAADALQIGASTIYRKLSDKT
ncbi:MAG: sigma 54-interacting transcriptional regulator, partial [Alphaproteobacteria bacterium]|nr:sigma 54-interacting transcriptional regulator [Alphaproteobacteria bacterium]